MLLIDNRHLDYSNTVQVGDLVMTEERNYIFIIEEGNDYPCHQVDIDTFNVVASYQYKAFKTFEVGTVLEHGGKITDIVKNKNLVLDIRK